MKPKEPKEKPQTKIEKPKKRYRVIHGQFLDETVAAVNEAIKDGWTPKGEMRIAILRDEPRDEPLFYQTMVWEEGDGG